ncbi:hypothetical protein C8Q69DRAFT_499191 [Paecilomyces variotii]|uniref:Uncharacterized protein n=1 Tax=Byssochlamys spectabilis TaxID=264951 RepID=A0A443HRK5_BYSSP|nr:hypothetical protein C8Q69DRAFT_499191 [Paecilomyces variotii]KAJ9365609.1 hypothetical protein DTO280E4_578 [Paecilomyces variotii]RWQ94417.1 hypothetical protein C8Q69DRAFT_499191 [Paecilomyces variotii]
MDFIAFILAWIITFGAPVQGQIGGGLDPSTGTFICSKVGGTYCDGKSMETATLISCLSLSVAEFHWCNAQLVNALPDDFKQSALCYQSSESAGDAVCAFNGTGYYLDGSSISLPETLLSNLEPLDNPAEPELSSLGTATQGTAVPDLTSGTFRMSTVVTPTPRNTITKSTTPDPTTVNDPGCPAFIPTKTIRPSTIVRHGSSTSKTTVVLASYRSTVYTTKTIQMMLATTKSSTPNTLYPVSVVTMAVGDSSNAAVSPSLVHTTVFGTLPHTGLSRTANAAPPYSGQGAFVALLAFAAAVF